MSNITVEFIEKGGASWFSISGVGVVEQTSEYPSRYTIDFKTVDDSEIPSSWSYSQKKLDKNIKKFRKLTSYNSGIFKLLGYIRLLYYKIK
ncbi:hypothetical protein PPL_05013 [Heterostelium album PN500]|uniref:Uncharacterized protein n=1 Tax=Heterostelium pallidum (strain ATCC 26659 / Pp 5 / PN500) TaxID=670386 RepID=D3B969_HETP5|nr:hypothetical protein PPL_05013 [Heterostelium album PN500]EFA82108.1 hypothetical protein PPL_05013 [Heterostelium album PN500]|eukprot:XP_020434225.1 hypothetical protein PPL_05013 [Heterostelium album PN500]